MSYNIAEKSFSHQGPNGSFLTATRCDFRDGLVIERPKKISDAEFAVDMATIFGYHALNIQPGLHGGFNGYDLPSRSVTVRIV